MDVRKLHPFLPNTVNGTCRMALGRRTIVFAVGLSIALLWPIQIALRLCFSGYDLQVTDLEYYPRRSRRYRWEA